MDLGTFQRKLAKRVRTLRAERGLRQDAFEEHGIAWKTIQKIEYGITDPKMSTLIKLASAFRVSLQTLLGFDDGGGSPRSR